MKQVISLVVVSVLFISTEAFAGGFHILEQSAEGVGNAYAGSVAGYGDGSEVYVNPAAMSFMEGTKVSFGGHFIIPSSEFSDKGSTNVVGLPVGGGDGPDGGETAFVPNFYVVHQLNDDWHLGFGVSAPFGLATEYDRQWVGRYQAVESELTNINLTPAVSYKVSDNFSIGAGLNIMYLDATLSNAVDFGSIGVGALGLPTAASLGLLPQQADGFAEVEGDDWAVGFHLGAAYEYAEDSRVGLSWHSRTQSTLTGDAKFEVPSNAAILMSNGLFADSGASANVDLPEFINAGFKHKLNSDFSLLGEVQWTRWTRFDELRINFNSAQPDSVVDEGWNNTWRYSLAVNYHPCEDWLFKAGFTYDEEPIADDEHRTPRIPGNDRKWMAFGADYQITDDVLVGLSYAHLFVSDASSNTTDSVGNSFVGDWDLGVDIVSGHVQYTF